MPELPPSNQPVQDWTGSECREKKVRRLIYRSSYTGTRETDKLLGAFSREILPDLSPEDLDHYEKLLDFGDPNIWAWASGQTEVPDNIRNPVLDRLIKWCQDKQPQ